MTPEEVEKFLDPYFKKQIGPVKEEDARFVLETSYKAEMPNLQRIPFFGSKEIVRYDYPELVALCPFTKIPDLYRSIITFVPNRYVCELKSLRMYYIAYRTLPISHEMLASKIYSEFMSVIKPEKIHLRLEVTVRGGVTTTIELGDEI